MSKFIVTFPGNVSRGWRPGIDPRFPLKGTVIAFSMERAQKFESREAAQTALEKARQFMKAHTFKSARIDEVES